MCQPRVAQPSWLSLVEEGGARGGWESARTKFDGRRVASASGKCLILIEMYGTPHGSLTGLSGSCQEGRRSRRFPPRGS